MQHRATRWFSMLFGLGLIALTSGCFQQAGAVLEASPVAFDALAAVPSETPFIPTETPTEELLPIEEPTPTIEIIEVAQVPSETPTPDELATLDARSTEIAATQTALLFTATPDRGATLNAEETSIALTVTARAMIPTETPTPTETPDIVATLNAESTGIAGTQVADAALIQDDFSATATALAIFALGGDPNAFQEQPIDPFAEQGDMDPLFATATQAIIEATSTAAMEQTLTMQAILGELSTPIPTFDPFLLTLAAQQTLDAGGGIIGGGNEFATETSFAPAPSGTCAYVVQHGDNLFRISLRYNTTVHEIAAISGITNIHLIVVGQTIYIPNCGGTNVPPNYTHTWAPPPPGGCRAYYRVRQNDNMFRIAINNGLTLQQLGQANPQVTNLNLIFIDQELCLP